MNTHRFNTHGTVTLLLMGLLASGSALAQITASAEQSATGGELQEIVVTAQKRLQNAQDVGISISAISGSALEGLGAVAATDITKFMPAVVMTQPNGPSSFSLSIRGVTQNDFADHQESPAAIYIDDVYVSQMAGLAFSLFDIDRVEVLRGPQGTLFGRNATGGLANFVTRRPSDDAGGYVDITAGERNLTRIEGAVTGPLLDGVDGRLSFQSNHYDPLFTNLYPGGADAENGNDYALRGQLLFKLPAQAELLVSGRYSREDVHAGSWEERPTYNVAPGVDVYVPGNLNPYGTCDGCNASGLPASGPFNIRDNVSGFARLQFLSGTAKYTQPFGNTTLTVIGDYSHFAKDYQEDSDASPVTLFEFFNGSRVGQESLEARLNGNEGKLNWTAGVYGLWIDGDYYEGWIGPAFYTASAFDNAANPNEGSLPGAWPYGTFPYYNDFRPSPDGGIPATRSPYSLQTRSYATFGQIEYRATDLIGMTLGARFTRDDKDYHFTWYPYEFFPGSSTGQILQLSPDAGTALTNYTASRADDLVSGKAQLDFHLSQDMLAYASYNRGVKGGGFTAPLFPITISDLSTLTFHPETLYSYEVGFKSEFLNHTLRFNTAAYYYDYRNYQALVYTVALEQLIENADATHKGAEAELQWVPNASWQFGLGVAYVDALVKDVDARGTGVKGNWTPPNAPRWSGNALARYNVNLPPGQLAFQVDGTYLSRFWFNLTELPIVEQPGFGLMNARVFYTPKSQRLEIGASIENLANKHYGVMGFDNTGINGLAQLYPGDPRWWKVHVIYHF